MGKTTNSNVWNWKSLNFESVGTLRTAYTNGWMKNWRTTGTTITLSLIVQVLYIINESLCLLLVYHTHLSYMSYLCVLHYTKLNCVVSITAYEYWIEDEFEASQLWFYL